MSSSDSMPSPLLDLASFMRDMIGQAHRKPLLHHPNKKQYGRKTTTALLQAPPLTKGGKIRLVATRAPHIGNQIIKLKRAS